MQTLNFNIIILSVKFIMKASVKINNIILKYADERLLNFKKLNKRKDKIYSLTSLNCKLMRHLKLNDENDVINN